MEKRWHILTAEPAVVATLRASLGCHPVMAALLANRHLESPEQAQGFLNASLSQLRPPTGLKDLEPAVARTARAVTSGETILLFGDYDVDGTTATAVLFEFLKACGASVTYYIPHRLKEGYGLQVRHVSEVAVPRRAALLITVDCGSGSYAAEAARAAGSTSSSLPSYIRDRSERSGRHQPQTQGLHGRLDRLAGGRGVLPGARTAKHLPISILRDRTEPNMRLLCDMVAWAPLRTWCRCWTKPHPGERGREINSPTARLVALLDAAGISNRPGLEDIAFRLGPRLNAGRLDHAWPAVDLLTTDRLTPPVRSP
jgi:single-stranded-DNA-specific exonuclease